MKINSLKCGQNKQPVRNMCLILFIISALGLLHLVVSRRHLENSMFSYLVKAKHFISSGNIHMNPKSGTWLPEVVQPIAAFSFFTNTNNTELVARQKTSRDTDSKNTVNVQQNRSDSCDKCFVNEFDLLLDNKNICKLYNGRSKIDLIILITSSSYREENRNIIRRTWASVTTNNTGTVRHVFLFGDTGDSHSNFRLSLERSKYGDIIQGDFLDSYNNLTYKTMMGLKWVIENCNWATFVLKTDDDMWVNIPALLIKARDNYNYLLTGLAGYCHIKSKPVRDPDSKYYVPLNSYPHAHYPTFCSGTGYLLSMHTARNIYIMSHDIPFFYLEDIYIALCVNKLGYKAKTLPGFHSWNIAETDPCYYKSSHVITIHGIDFEFMKIIWNTVCHAQN